MEKVITTNKPRDTSTEFWAHFVKQPYAVPPELCITPSAAPREIKEQIKQPESLESEWDFLGTHSPITKLIFKQINESEYLGGNVDHEELGIYHRAMNFITSMLPKEWEIKTFEQFKSKMSSLDEKEGKILQTAIFTAISSSAGIAWIPANSPQEIDSMSYAIRDGLYNANTAIKIVTGILRQAEEGAQHVYDEKYGQNPYVPFETKKAEEERTEQLKMAVRDLVTYLEPNDESKIALNFPELFKIIANPKLGVKNQYEAWLRIVIAYRTIVTTANAERKNGAANKVMNALIEGGFFKNESAIDELVKRKVYSRHLRSTGECIEVTLLPNLFLPDEHTTVLVHEMPSRLINNQEESILAKYSGRNKEQHSMVLKDSIKNGVLIDDDSALRINALNEQDAVIAVESLFRALVSSGLKFYIDTTSGITQTIIREGINVRHGAAHFEAPYTENTHNAHTSENRKVIQFDIVIGGTHRVEVQIYTIQTLLNTIYEVTQFHDGYFAKKLAKNNGRGSTFDRMFPRQYLEKVLNKRQVSDPIIYDLENPELVELIVKGAHRNIFDGDKTTYVLSIQNELIRRVHSSPLARIYRRLKKMIG